MPLFSIVVPLFNNRETIARTLESIRAQTIGDFEILVINDGSTDGSDAVVEGFRDSRVRQIHQRNQGVSAARNRGIAEASAELVSFLDADDAWLPDFLVTIRRLAAAHPDAGMYATRYFIQHAREKRTPASVRGLPDDFEGLLKDYFRLAATSAPPVHTSAVCLRKKNIVALGNFPEGIAAGEDLLTWARMAFHWPVAYAMSAQSIYHQPETNRGFKPLRTPATDNRVGSELERLYRARTPPAPFLRRYIALWYRMRAATHLAWSQNAAARAFSLRGLRWYPFDPRLLAYLLLSFVPAPCARWVQTRLRRP